MSPLTSRKVAATAALLFVHAALIVSFDVLSGIAIGGTGLAVWASWTASHDPRTAGVFLVAGLLQIAALMLSLLAAGFEAIAAARALGGEPRLLRPAALAGLVVPVVWAPLSLPGFSCVGAVFWAIPFVIGLITFGLAREIAEESPPSAGWNR